jgi:hypothetical protein
VGCAETSCRYVSFQSRLPCERLSYSARFWTSNLEPCTSLSSTHEGLRHSSTRWWISLSLLSYTVFACVPLCRQVVHGLSDIGRSADGLNQAYLTFAMHNHPGTKTTEFLTKHTHLQKVLLSNNRVQVRWRTVAGLSGFHSLTHAGLTRHQRMVELASTGIRTRAWAAAVRWPGALHRAH